jgi:hypothetical protein
MVVPPHYCALFYWKRRFGMEITLVRTKAVPQVTIKSNEKGWPSFYRCNFLEPGICSYEDVGQGIALLKKESMDSWIQSFKGRPVIIDHQDVDPSNFKRVEVGYITNVLYNAATGWYDCDFLIDKDEGHETIDKGWSVSCSFDVLETLPGGEWHASKYDEEIVKGNGLHLALVQTPRYEDCRITRVNNSIKWNSKDTKIKANKTDFSIMSPLQIDKYMSALSDVGLQTIIDGEYEEDIKKVAKAHTGDRAKKKEEELMAQKNKEVKNTVELTKKGGSMKWKLFSKKGEKIENDKIDTAKVFVDVDGEKVPLSTLMNSVGEEFEILQESDSVKINGKDVSIKDLVDVYKQNKKSGDGKVKSRTLTNEEMTVFNSLPSKEKQQEFLRILNDDKKKDDDCDPKKKMDDAQNAFDNAKNEYEKEKDDDKKKKMDDAKKALDDAKKEYEDDVKKKEDDKKKADDAKKKDDDEEKDPEKKNAKKNYFLDLENARSHPIEKEPARGGADTREDRAARGRKSFGSKKKST